MRVSLTAATRIARRLHPQACDAKGLQDLPPHVYALAEAAFRGMLVERKPQVGHPVYG